jgi:hypothetical protein
MTRFERSFRIRNMDVARVEERKGGGTEDEGGGTGAKGGETEVAWVEERKEGGK